MKSDPNSKILDSMANQGALKILARVLQSESPLALVGAGMSRPAGFPSWKELVDMMDGKLGTFKNDYRSVLKEDGDLLWRAGEYRQMMGEGKFYKLMKATFGKRLKLTPDDPAVIFAKLPFRHFITTNYDDVIRSAHQAAGKEAPRLLN